MERTCPSCSTAMRFERSGSWARVCAKCDALVLRTGERYAEATSLMPLLEDLSPMRVGSVGRYDGKEFRIIGRVRVEAENGYRNFWSLHAPDLPYRWLVHAYGAYSLMHRPSVPFQKGVFGNVAVGRTLVTDKDPGFIVEYHDRKFRFAWEGELMERLDMKYTLEVEAGRGPNGKLVVHFRGTEPEALVGIMVDFAELGLQDASELARWS